MREKYTDIEITTVVMFRENKIESFDRKNTTEYSFRVIKDGFMGVHYQVGEMSDEEGFAKAEKKLELKRPYKFEAETGERHRDKVERMVPDKDVLKMAKEGLKHICDKYPDFVFTGSFNHTLTEKKHENEKGLNYTSKDCSMTIAVNFKHKDSKDIMDGAFSISDRKLELEQFYEMTDNYLSNYMKEVELPEEIILQTQYYGMIGKLVDCLDAEKLVLGTSLLTGKLGEKVFSEELDLFDDTSDEESWHSLFCDGEGVVLPNDKMDYINKGVVLRGYADKKTAEKYGVEHTGSATRTFSDIPSNGGVGMKLGRSSKTIKELLNGRKSIVLLMSGGGGYNEKGDYVMPVHNAMLCDGEKMLGRLKPFTLKGNMFEMFGEGYIGVGSDKPVFNDKSVLIKMSATT